jgi:hypothetical protein
MLSEKRKEIEKDKKTEHICCKNRIMGLAHSPNLKANAL